MRWVHDWNLAQAAETMQSDVVRGRRIRLRWPVREGRPYRRRTLCRVAPCARTPSPIPAARTQGPALQANDDL